MFGIADNQEFLAEIGIENLPNRDAVIADLENLAQKKLTVKLAERLTPAQMEEFSNLTDERQAADWLTVNLPDFSDLVTECFAEIKDEFVTVKAKAESA